MGRLKRRRLGEWFLLPPSWEEDHNPDRGVRLILFPKGKASCFAGVEDRLPGPLEAARREEGPWLRLRTQDGDYQIAPLPREWGGPRARREDRPGIPVSPCCGGCRPCSKILLLRPGSRGGQLRPGRGVQLHLGRTREREREGPGKEGGVLREPQACSGAGGGQ
jgi:hypothetical protein